MGLHQVQETDGRSVVKSILDLDENHELFVLFTNGKTNGPAISRTGKSSPTMTNLIAPFGPPTSNATLQRHENLVVDDEIRQREVENLQELTTEEGLLAEHLSAHLEDLRKQQTYLEVFAHHYPDYRVTAMQGFGDLTMNLWNVAYINDKVTKRPEILHLFQEPLGRRTYSCLVKWKSPITIGTGATQRATRYTIQDLRFNRYAFNQDHYSKMVVVDQNEQGIADRIEFAVFGQHLVKDSVVVPDLEEQVHQFGDIRHVFQLPNINPEEKLFDDDPGFPRTYFGRAQEADLWFGEAQLLESRNLRTSALRGSIELDLRRPGVSVELLRAALEASGYREIDSDKRVLTRQALDSSSGYQSEWRLVEDSPHRIEILLKENIYPCTMVGTRKDGGVSLLAWKGVYSKQPGWTLRMAASHIAEQSVTDAILCDEGGDVFQYFRENEDAELQSIIQPGRSQHRAVLIAATKTGDSAS